MKKLYPSLHPYQHFTLQVDDIHDLYVEECGNPDGIPIVFLHGGPGAGCGSMHRRYFNPDKYRIILFDQRGCGRSSPHTELENNTTQLLVSDMEQIRKKLGINKWALFGGSWGSTLAFVYSQTHPERVTGIIARGIYFSTAEEINWLYQHGTSLFFPDYWQDFIAPIPKPERESLLKAYHKRLTGDDEIARIRAAKSWSKWEACISTLTPNKAVLESFSDSHTALSIACIEAHYFINNGFLKHNEILDNAHQLSNIPGYIIQGRYDMICPADSAYKLHQAWPNSKLVIVEGSGHSAHEEGVISELIKATDKLLLILDTDR